MNVSDAYDLHWKSIPLGAIESYLTGWYEPYLGRGVYLFVLSTTCNTYVGYYVGKSEDIGRRWAHHVSNWFKNPQDGYSLPKNVDAFLRDPVAVFNQGDGLATGTSDTKIQRQLTGNAMLDRTWFCWAEVACLPGDTIVNVECKLQEALKRHVGIKKNGEIGDKGGHPTSASIRNHFGRQFLVPVLPETIP